MSCGWCGDAATPEGFCKPPAWCAHNARRERENEARARTAREQGAAKRAARPIVLCRQCGQPIKQPSRGRRVDCLPCGARKTQHDRNASKRRWDAKTKGKAA